jgi:uncharacterized SAM-binding protein YcdF (DUF218 family)
MTLPSSHKIDVIFRRRKLLKSAIVFCFVLTFLSALAWIFPQQLLTVDNGEVKADVIVVMGGAWLERPQRAAELFREGEAPKVIVSGSGDYELNKQNLEQSGVSDAAITLETNSYSTRENAKFTIAILRAQQLKSAIIVTSWYHSRRALACFEHYAPDIKFYSRPSYFDYLRKATGAERKEQERYVRAEYVKLLGYWVCYGVCPL